MRKLLFPLTLSLSACTSMPDGFDPAHRLIGLGCGAERLTFTAMEEDHFPAPCYAVGTAEELCPGTGADTAECATYLGKEGW
jgi:hypothetical protein